MTTTEPINHAILKKNFVILNFLFLFLYDNNMHNHTMCDHQCSPNRQMYSDHTLCD
ncbi:unnamed protein product, partial [Brachionus calyciflorus]